MRVKIFGYSWGGVLCFVSSFYWAYREVTRVIVVWNQVSIRGVCMIIISSNLLRGILSFLVGGFMVLSFRYLHFDLSFSFSGLSGRWNLGLVSCLIFSLVLIS